MKIEFYLTGYEIQQLREIIDNAPLNPYAPVIVKILAALPLSGNDTTISLTPAGTAPASENTQVAGRGFSEDTDLGYDPPDWLPGNDRRTYADSVGMPLHEKIR